jgi:oligoendopeptidase F
MRVRGYSSVLESRLKPFNIPLEVFHNLLDTFRDNLPVWHKYWDVKRRALGYDEIYPYDIWAPLGANPPKVTFAEAVEMVAEGNAPLGDEYTSVLRKGCLEEHWVDWAPNDTKQQGAFSSFGIENLVPLIMMSFTDDVSGMSTLSHELGHSMHTYYTGKHQPVVYSASYPSMTLAETASNTNQAMTRAYLRESRADDDEFQLALLEEAMANYHRYLFQMLNLATFELEVYTRAEEGKPLSAGILQDIMKEIYAAGYGETMTDDPDRTGTTWAQFGHLYIPFYTFQYSVGISAADMLTAKISRELSQVHQHGQLDVHDGPVPAGGSGHDFPRTGQGRLPGVGKHGRSAGWADRLRQGDDSISHNTRIKSSGWYTCVPTAFLIQAG